MSETPDRGAAEARSTIATDRPETSTFAMSSIIFVSVTKPVHTLKPLRRKGNRPVPFEIMESSTQQTEGKPMTTTLASLTIQRTARKAYRCAGADEVERWGVRSRHELSPADHEWSGWSSMPDRETAEARAAEMVGARAGGQPGREYRYTAAEAVPTMNPHYRADCLVDIQPGDRYVEDRMDAMPWESGLRFCQRCGGRLTDDRL